MARLEWPEGYRMTEPRGEPGLDLDALGAALKEARKAAHWDDVIADALDAGDALLAECRDNRAELAVVEGSRRAAREEAMERQVRAETAEAEVRRLREADDNELRVTPEMVATMGRLNESRAPLGEARQAERRTDLPPHPNLAAAMHESRNTERRTGEAPQPGELTDAQPMGRGEPLQAAIRAFNRSARLDFEKKLLEAIEAYNARALSPAPKDGP